jgi:type VI secretion system secreted protein VgrG
VKGGQHLFDGGANKSANLLNLPGELSEESKHWIALQYVNPETNEGIAEAEYEIHFVGGPVLTGMLDKDGKARHENVLNKPVKKILYKPRQAARPQVAPKLEDILKG